MEFIEFAKYSNNTNNDKIYTHNKLYPTTLYYICTKVIDDISTYMLYLKTVGISRLKNSSYFLIFLDIKGHYCNFDFYHVVYLYLEDCDSTIVAFNYIKDIENLLYSYINNSKLAICENAYTIFMKISNNSSISIKYPRYIEYLELDMQF